MKTTLKTIATILVLSIVVLSSCKKYEEGPSISLRTKKARLCNDWTLTSATVTTSGGTSTDITSTVKLFFTGMNIEKDGTYKTVGNSTTDGKWELGEDKDDVTFTPSTAGATATTNRILMLKNKELWLRQTSSNGDVTVYKYN